MSRRRRLVQSWQRLAWGTRSRMGPRQSMHPRTTVGARSPVQPHARQEASGSHRVGARTKRPQHRDQASMAGHQAVRNPSVTILSHRVAIPGCYGPGLCLRRAHGVILWFGAREMRAKNPTHILSMGFQNSPNPRARAAGQAGEVLLRSLRRHGGFELGLRHKAFAPHDAGHLHARDAPARRGRPASARRRDGRASIPSGPVARAALLTAVSVLTSRGLEESTQGGAFLSREPECPTGCPPDRGFKGWGLSPAFSHALWSEADMHSVGGGVGPNVLLQCPAIRG